MRCLMEIDWLQSKSYNKNYRDILSLNEVDGHQHALIDRYRHLILLTDMIDDKELME